MTDHPRYPAGASVGERGAGAVELVITVGLLLTIVVAATGVLAWPAQMSATTAAAAEAARAVVNADDVAGGQQLGTERARQVLINHGIDPDRATVTFAGVLERGEPVTATVALQLPPVRVPGVGQWGPYRYSRSHAERVPDYRGLR